LGKNQATKLGIEPATYRATTKHATYCATETTRPIALNSLLFNFF
jgi:hypothetical protein